jgi:alpha-beta hydrolase superfamily lysophospholipase
MGSFALQQYLLDHSADLDGAVLSGTSALDLIASGIDPSQEVDLSAFNAPFQPSRTEYDWLSRDPAEVDAYVADPACGFGLGSSSVGGMLEGLAPTADQQRLAVISRHLPIYLMSGEDDPLAGGGALIDVVADRYREAGVLDVTVARYQGARHELFNETNRDEVTADLLTWLDRVVGG